MTTWRKEISAVFEANKDTWDNVVETTLSSNDLDLEFDSGYGRPEGKPVTLWTKDRVYYPIVYDGSEWVSSAPRNPCTEACEHKGSY